MGAFCGLVVQGFGVEYLREPREDDLKRIMELGAARGFPGCIGSISCQHWERKNCPIARARHFKEKEKKPTIVVEAIADGELWISYAFFGNLESSNDISVLEHSTTMEQISADPFHPFSDYKVNGRFPKLLHYPADGIYSNLVLFSKTTK